MTKRYHTARQAAPPQPLNSPEDVKQRFGFLLVPRFTLTGFSAAIEPLRMANMAANMRVFSAFTITLDGKPVPASNGVQIMPDYSTDSMPSVDIVLICGANPIGYPDVDHLTSWLRGLAHSGITLGSIDSGSDLLARAGLLDGYRCTIHWQDLQLTRARYRRALFSNQIYVIDRDRFTAGGGTAAADMMFEIIRRSGAGNDLATAAADLLVYDRIRQGDDRQRATLSQQSDANHQGFSNALAIVEKTLSNPVPTAELAASVKLSKKRLEQFFRDELGCTPAEYYRELRLKEARQHLVHTDARVGDIARLCGFRTTSHFSRSYRDFFGVKPSEDRNPARKEMR